MKYTRQNLAYIFLHLSWRVNWNEIILYASVHSNIGKIFVFVFSVNSLHGVSLKITLTVPVRNDFIDINYWINLLLYFPWILFIIIHFVLDRRQGFGSDSDYNLQYGRRKQSTVSRWLFWLKFVILRHALELEMGLFVRFFNLFVYHFSTHLILFLSFLKISFFYRSLFIYFVWFLNEQSFNFIVP